MELLNSFSKHYSPYNNQIRLVIEQARAEIRFERFLFAGDWNSAMKCINLVRLTNRTSSLMMLAELRKRQNEPIAALEAIDHIINGSGGTGKNGPKSGRVPFVGATLSGGNNGFFRNDSVDADLTVMNGSSYVCDEENSVITGENMISANSSLNHVPLQK